MKILLVDEQDRIIGSKERNDRDENDVVRVSGLIVFNSKNEILLAQRSLNKVFNPGKWGPAVAGTLEENETYISNIVKETEEEIGIKIHDDELVLGPYEFVKTKHRYFRQMYYLKLDLPLSEFTIQKEEVDGLKWVGINDLEIDLNNNPSEFTESSPKLIKEFISFLRNTS